MLFNNSNSSNFNTGELIWGGRQDVLVGSARQQLAQRSAPRFRAQSQVTGVRTSVVSTVIPLRISHLCECRSKSDSLSTISEHNDKDTYHVAKLVERLEATDH